MPTNEQRRQAAKRKLERQLVRRAERAKRRKQIAVVSTVVVTVLAVGGIYLLVTHKDNPASANSAASSAAKPTTTKSSAPATPAKTTGGPCQYAQDATGKAAKDVGTPNDPNPTPNTGAITVTLKTNEGDIPLTLDRAKAPCTVQSFEFLATKQYFDSTPCHRMTTGAGLKVLQCGDPSGTGTGGPGYKFKDETNQGMTYPRGTLAMANSGPNTNGSQFFMVYGDSQLPPSYTVFGTIDAAGLAVLDKVAAGGVTAGQNGAGDGAPKIPVNIQQAVVAS